jgi:hypothetical protein
MSIKQADLAAMHVPPWLVHQRDGRDLDTHRKVDLAVFSHPSTRDARRFNVCAQRSVCTAIEMKRDVSVKSMRKAVSQLTQDYATTVGTQFVGERRVMFGIVGTAAELRFCQVWSDAHVRARVSPLVSIADAAEVADLLKDTNKKWCDVVASKSAFLQHIARVVLHGASGPTIDSGLKVPQGDYSVAIGNGIERIRFVGVLGCTKRSIVLSADVFDADGKTKRIAFKRYVAKASEGARRREVAALQQFGVLPGVVSLVGFGGIELNDIEWIATEPVGTALSQMCLCSSATRLAVVEALRGGPVAALQALHECNHLFADIHRGNIILTRADGGTTEESTASTTTAATSAATLRFDAKFVDLESVRAVAEEPNSPTLDITAETAEDDNKNLETVINSIESGT